MIRNGNVGPKEMILFRRFFPFLFLLLSFPYFLLLFKLWQIEIVSHNLNYILFMIWFKISDFIRTLLNP